MKILWISFLCALGLLLTGGSPAYAEASVRNPWIYPDGFFTPRDLSFTSSISTSNIRLQNNQNSASVVYGIYIAQLAYVLPGLPCSAATPMYSSSNNVAAGAMVMPVRVNAKGSAPVGSSYLYNMLYNANFYVNLITPSRPSDFGCQLPGCSWATDTVSYNWCIYLGVLAPVYTTSGYTSTVPPSTDTVSDSEYNYNAISNYVILGPISCDDQTLTCSVATPQSQPVF